MTRLLESDFPNKHRDFEHVLANEADAPEARHLAALHLGMIDTRAALDALIAQTAIRDEYVLTGVLKALGRIGDVSALSAIERVLKTATGTAAAQAALAAAFIAHRLNLPGHALPVPSSSDYAHRYQSAERRPTIGLWTPAGHRCERLGCGALPAIAGASTARRGAARVADVRDAMRAEHLDDRAQSRRR